MKQVAIAAGLFAALAFTLVVTARADVPTGYQVPGPTFYALNDDGTRVAFVWEDCKAPSVYNNPETRDESCIFELRGSEGTTEGDDD